MRMRVTAQGLSVSEARQIIDCAYNESSAHERRSPQKQPISSLNSLCEKRQAKLLTKTNFTEVLLKHRKPT